MNSILVVMLVLSGLLSAFLMYRLLLSGRSAFEKFVYCAVLLVPLLGPLIYIFLSEEVPPQSPMLRNNGPRGSYTNRMIAIRENMKEAARKKVELQKNEVSTQDNDDVGTQQ